MEDFAFGNTPLSEGATPSPHPPLHGRNAPGPAFATRRTTRTHSITPQILKSRIKARLLVLQMHNFGPFYLPGCLLEYRVGSKSHAKEQKGRCSKNRCLYSSVQTFISRQGYQFELLSKVYLMLKQFIHTTNSFACEIYTTLQNFSVDNNQSYASKRH